MDRRCLLIALAASAAPALASSAWSAASAHQEIADWLFDLYAGQSVRLSIANALRARPPGTEDVLAPTAPAMVRALARHRPVFVAKMTQALESVVSAADASTLLPKTKSQPPALDESARRILFDADAAFRRDAQDVIGAMTTDIGLMIAATLGQAKQ